MRSIRQLDLKKAPSVSETLDWARTLLLLNIETIDEKTAKETLHILLKYQTDIAKATKELSVEEQVGAMTDIAPRPTGGMLDLLNGFVVELRNAGLPVSLTENLDAMEAVQHIPIEDREAFKYALGATLIKNNSHWRAFETVFEVYFSPARPGVPARRGRRDALDELWREMQEQQQGEGRGAAGGSMDSLTPEEIAQMLMQALLQRRPGDDAGARQAVGAALRRHGAGPAGRRHVLPVPHAAQPRPRRRCSRS